MKEKELTNPKHKKNVIQIDLEKLYPKDIDIVFFDIHPFLYKALIVKEKELREKLKTYDWDKLKSKYVCIHCSSPAIIPMWAYMLISAYIAPLARQVITQTNSKNVKEDIFCQNIETLDIAPYKDKRLIVKGCAHKNIQERHFVKLFIRLQRVAKSIAYGEFCSTVPIYKQ